MKWELFCRVIDNHGDLGVCWRLASELARRGEQVRLWCDDVRALAWMAPGGQAGVEVLPWQDIAPPGGLGEVVIEAFGCEPPPAVLADIGQADPAPAWINLEYLSAEGYVARCHALPSPVMAGPAAGRTRWFFYPGFTADTGGLLREADLLQRQQSFDVAAWRARHGVAPGTLAVSLFCYEPGALPDLLGQPNVHLLVTPGRAAAAVRALAPTLPVTWLPAVPQPAFDEMLWAADLNFVRGEDSLLRALWAGQPFVWQIYPQDDGAHAEKLQAFLDWLQAPPSLREAHAVWNGLAPGTLPELSPARLAEWQDCVHKARKTLQAQTDLATQLIRFAHEKH
ncbi:elongation factor P maturation arginine rhamnosyltransferase EarP [Pseudorhodoferax sp. Leaf267]|uniref:elongation factor P maturation arginine rhamnosyltransferase EarP n=1 Tax=Pseudorhodoferax sp. Leaf267 TaxID=1736316 RepID=UPI0006F7B6C5|nr:elongation factor P maturation arginine rhamnosyltransferase EarP [Pseudorhodoferax sp. Leaf267]KQP14370.1 hypothetical protein ASF43_16300 [Pseudorhodoferax sp. Leaf267]